MRKPSKLIALALALLLTGGILTRGVQAAPPSATYDEAVFVNLDHYGKISNCSVVKGVALNGTTSFTDYGNYKEVNNMSGYEKPDRTHGGLCWKLPAGTDRLYYEVQIKDRNVELPWNFDISYKLNGQPAFADKLAGAQGLIEIKVHVIPNSKAQAYYLNNMLLQVAMPVNMEHTLSIEAPGSQLQSMGTYKMVVFMALPGQEDTYTIRIGSDSFETMGIAMTMLPGTSGQLQVIKDLRDTRTSYAAAYESLYQSYNDLLNVILSMDSGLSQLKTGVENLDQYTSMGDIEKITENMNDLSANLRKLAQNTDDLVAPTDSASGEIAQLSAQAEELNSSLDEVSKDLNSYKNSLSDLKNTINKYQQIIKNTQSYKSDREELSQELNDDLGNIKTDLTALKGDCAEVTESLQELENYLVQLNDYLDSIGEMPALNAEDYYLDPEEVPPEVADPVNNMIDSVVAEINGAIEEYNANLDSVIAQMKAFNNVLIHLVDSIKMLMTDMQSLLQHSSDLTNTLQKLLVFLDGGSSKNGLLDNADEALDLTLTLLQQAEDICDTITHSISVLQNTISAIQAMNALLIQTGKTAAGALHLFSSTLNSLSQTCNTLADLSDALSKRLTQGFRAEESAHQIMQGLEEVLEQSIKGLTVSYSLQGSGNTMHDTLGSQIDRLEAGSNILSLNPDAKLISFTSGKNCTPESIQVILRTQEITLNKTGPSHADSEKQETDRGVFGRILDIFIKIWKAFISIFT